jgi:hypothetical protein
LIVSRLSRYSQGRGSSFKWVRMRACACVSRATDRFQPAKAYDGAGKKDFTGKREKSRVRWTEIGAERERERLLPPPLFKSSALQGACAANAEVRFSALTSPPPAPPQHRSSPSPRHPRCQTENSHGRLEPNRCPREAPHLTSPHLTAPHPPRPSAVLVPTTSRHWLFHPVNISLRPCRLITRPDFASVAQLIASALIDSRILRFFNVFGHGLLFAMPHERLSYN